MRQSTKYFIFSHPMLIAFLLSVVSCAPVISKQIRDHVKPDLTFREVLNDPERYKDQMVILSGVIIETKNTKEGTLLTVLQRPAGFRGKPKNVDESEGRFLALDSRYLDPTIFEKDRAVTIAGEVQEKRTLRLGETDYVYPLIDIKEVYLWPVEKRYYSPYPSWHIGFG